MKDNFYSDIASEYDTLVGTDTGEWADYIERIIAEYAPNSKEMLDMGCGTGKLTLELSRRGYDMTGLDSNQDMLAKADDLSRQSGMKDKILWLCQDMTSFELYGTVDVTVSCLDCINHLTSKKDVEKCFSLVHNYLIPDGLFVFDINSQYKFENIYAKSDFILENKNTLCAWQNSYNKKTGICDFYVSLFSLDRQTGLYFRRDSLQKERMYKTKDICKMLENTGFSILRISGDMQGTSPNPEDERLYFVARAIKN